MEYGKYYVVEVEFIKGNWRHKAIFYYDGKPYESDIGTLYSKGYESPKDVRIENLHYFNVISEIKDMN